MPVGPMYTLIVLPSKALTQTPFTLLVARATALAVTACCALKNVLLPPCVTNHGVVFAVLPGCTVQVPLCVAGNTPPVPVTSHAVLFAVFPG